jgi:hypothetical protein
LKFLESLFGQSQGAFEKLKRELNVSFGEEKTYGTCCTREMRDSCHLLFGQRHLHVPMVSTGYLCYSMLHWIGVGLVGLGLD